MEKKKVSKRLYVGGLGHTVSKAELQERFGKFGRVLDVEIITRKDEQGNPTKTFAYITVSSSESDLRKCISILNKTKWGGRTLQIEFAKESFLHRLAMEREEAKLQKEKPRRKDETVLLESLKKAGVVDFHMRAVPGTEVPDHKNWIVGKFGRVLPILHLRNQQKNKIVKYDPSKYCHNLRKLEEDLTHVVPVSKLTWHLEEKDDSISKKRQGEFPVTKEQPKKLRQLGSQDVNGVEVLPSGCRSRLRNISSSQLDQRSKTKSSEKSELPPSSLNSNTSGQSLLLDKNSISRVVFPNNRMHATDSDIDSEEEIRAMMIKKMEKEQTKNFETESDHLEIVGDNFELKYNTHWSLGNRDSVKKVVKGNSKERGAMDWDNGYDSADTDEIIAESKAPGLSSTKTAVLENAKQVKVENKQMLSSKECDLVNDSSLKTHNLREDDVESKEKMRKPSISALLSTAGNSTAKASHSESSYSESEEEESDMSSDYESMMQNCYRLDLTLDDLKALAAEKSETSVEEFSSTQSSSQCSIKESAKGNVVHKPEHSKIPPAVIKKCICPEDILAAILDGEEDADEESSKGRSNSCLKFQPFRGMGSLCNESTKDSTDLKKRSVGSSGFEASLPFCGEKSPEGQSENHPFYSLEVSTKKNQNIHCERHKELSDAASLPDKNVCGPRLQGTNTKTNSLQGEQNSEYGDVVPCTDEGEGESSDMDSNAAMSQKHVKRQLKSPKLLSKKMKRDVSNTSSECEIKKCANRKMSLVDDKELPGSASKESDTKKQLQDNQKRLAALEERQKERQLQKKLIQGALSNLDSQPANKHKHIIFNSDMESEAEVEETLKQDESSEDMHGIKEHDPKSSRRLFESSEDDQDETDDERFKIKPQFEGKAGEKLLNLQSRFGTDERFRMDARFLESESEEEGETNTMEADEEEEEFAAEKKKNLQILGSLLNIDLEQSKTTKMAINAKKFKDINALRYDPTRQDHAVFEKKPKAVEKESKAKRKKKKEESEKLPEVSKEIYCDIAVDLKELFGSSKNKSKKKEGISWDKDEAEEATPRDHLGPDAESNTAQDSSDFKFSFFDDKDRSDVKEEPYVFEAIKPMKVKWQEDPRFQDSSSEDDDEPEATESERDKEMFLPLPQSGSVRFFFFSKDDERLREGPKLFCRSVNLNEEKDSWEDRRRLLLEECRKKHKDARRKVKTKQ
ncbi:nucleolar protein 8 [Meleagris gallopavo]|uniref:nucleolar protein 8 n=1 Tax=Meleagris gallopavo TaxID=9103 RepID=UPI0005499F98|nr:nucleolar protein 8 [Meleagris gallopavo]XP_010716700.1 nucleolar protein 8 [Meleagris gallopavo]